MKAITRGGIVRALIALGLVSYQAVPALAVGQAPSANAAPQWVTQLIVKEKGGTNSTLQLQSAGSDGTTMRVDVATVQRWSVAAQLPVTYKRAMSGGAHVVTLPGSMTLEDAYAVAQRMEASGQFEYVSPDRILRPAFTPTDSWFSSQWNLMASNATVTTIATSTSALQPTNATAVGGANLTTAWDTTKGAGVNVTVIDTGILHHADLSGATINTGSNFITNTFRNNSGDSVGTDPGDGISSTDITNNPTVCGGATPASSSWHGTFVTGLIASPHTGVHIAGIAPAVGIQMARALGRCGGAESDIIDALTWASGGAVPRVTPSVNVTPARVVNMSLGGAGNCDLAMQTAVTNARGRGAVVVVATGNESSTTGIDMPANCTGTIAVTAHTLEGDKANYANVGTGTTLSAPGGGNGSNVSGLGALIVSLSNSGTTSAGSDTYAGDAGTSMATPHVAGVAALMLSVNNTLTPDQIATILQQSARPFPAGTYCATHAGVVCGAGMLDAGAALSVTAGKPLVRASTSASTITANNAVTLTATGTPGFNSTTASVQWTQTSGPTASLSTAGPDANGHYTATFTPTVAGTYAFNVTWTNGTGGSATDSTQVSVAAAPTTGSGSTGGGTGTSTTTTTTSSSGGGGGALPLWLAGLLLAGGAFGLGRRRAS